MLSHGLVHPRRGTLPAKLAHRWPFSRTSIRSVPSTCPIPLRLWNATASFLAAVRWTSRAASLPCAPLRLRWRSPGQRSRGRSCSRLSWTRSATASARLRSSSTPRPSTPSSSNPLICSSSSRTKAMPGLKSSRAAAPLTAAFPPRDAMRFAPWAASCAVSTRSSPNCVRILPTRCSAPLRSTPHSSRAGRSSRVIPPNAGCNSNAACFPVKPNPMPSRSWRGFLRNFSPLCRNFRRRWPRSARARRTKSPKIRLWSYWCRAPCNPRVSMFASRAWLLGRTRRCWQRRESREWSLALRAAACMAGRNTLSSAPSSSVPGSSRS